ncbi:hypothetical protein DX928_18675 [Bacillus swezeyi]|nr:hypothetical protein DX928_18675 [Bacillus swezeyi]
MPPDSFGSSYLTFHHQVPEQLAYLGVTIIRSARERMTALISRLKNRWGSPFQHEIRQTPEKTSAFYFRPSRL